MGQHVIVGAGTVGSALAARLAERGHEVIVVSRRGTAPPTDGVRGVAADASDAAALAAIAAGADVIYNCANPRYHRWERDWPPIAASILGAAERSGAVLATLSNLYGYGPVDGAMTETLPLAATSSKGQVRATMWRDAKRAHDEGRVQATEVRASDFIGPRSQSYLGMLIPRVMAGKSCQVIGDPDAPHSWNYTQDVARALFTCAQDDRSWGRAWHAPANPPRSVRQAIGDIARLTGATKVKITKVPTVALRVLGLFNTDVRELPKTLYQFQVPFVIDDSETRSTFGLEPTPWDDVLKSSIDFFSSN